MRPARAWDTAVLFLFHRGSQAPRSLSISYSQTVISVQSGPGPSFDMNEALPRCNWPIPIIREVFSSIKGLLHALRFPGPNLKLRAVQRTKPLVG